MGNGGDSPGDGTTGGSEDAGTRDARKETEKEIEKLERERDGG